MEPCINAWRRWRRSCFSLESSSYCHHRFFLGLKQQTTSKYNYFPAGKSTISPHLPKGSFNILSLFQPAVPLCSESTIMATKIKGIYKGFKYISQIFVVKEREMEIGYPTDVKHVAHIGWDGSSGTGTAPSWMNEFKTGPDLTATSIGNSRVSNPTSLSTWSSQDFEQSMGSQPATEMMRNLSCTDLPNITKKQNGKKKSTSTPKSSSVKSSRTSKTKATYTQLGSTADLEM